MAIKALKTYGLKFKDLKEVCNALNDAELTTPITTKIGVKGEEMLHDFLVAIEKVPKGRLEEIPDVVSEYYDNLPQTVFDDADGDDEGAIEKTSKADAKASKKTKTSKKTKKDKPAKKTKKTKKKVTSDCPVFEKGWNPKEDDCKACKEDTPDEYEACKKAVEFKKKALKKKTKKLIGKRTRYGHTPGTMAGYIDDLVAEGKHTVEEMAEIVSKEFERTMAKAKAKVRGHIKAIENKGITVKTNKKGIVSAKEDIVDTMDPDNVVPWDA